MTSNNLFKRCILILVCMVFLSCDDTTNKSNSYETIVADSTVTDSLTYAEENFEEYADMYVLVCGISTNYYSLQSKMYDLHRTLSIGIDSMGRYYDTAKRKIILPEDDEDEIYAGEYFYRRYGEDFLSIEYMSSYTDDNDSLQMCIVAGVFDNVKTADSMLSIFQNNNYPATVIKTKMFMGCMH